MTDDGLAAVLFDLDGTLVDTEPAWLVEEQALAAAHGGTWSTEQGLSCVGQPLLESAERMRTEGGVDLPDEEIVQRLLTAVVGRVRSKAEWQPGVRDLLAALGAASVPLAIVTMSYRPLADAVVDALPAGTFQAVVTGDEVEHGKPHPEPYLTACARLGVPPRRCVVVEDSLPGIGSGLAAGCSVVGVPHLADLTAYDGSAGVTLVRSLTSVDLPFLRRLVTAD